MNQPNQKKIILLLFLMGVFCPSLILAEEIPWWNEDWSDRYRVVFPDFRKDDYAEVGVVTFRSALGEEGDPYDIRAIADGGTTVPVKVLNWTPDEEGLMNRGRVTCLLGLEAFEKTRDTTLHFYLGNPKAPLEFPNYAWKNPDLLIGSGLSSGVRRHGAWVWRPDPLFGAIHASVNTDTPPSRSTHSVTGLDSVVLHQSRTRIVQMVRLDPSAIPEAIGIDFIFSQGVHSAYWTAKREFTTNTLTTFEASWIGPLPMAGKWVRLEVSSKELKIKTRSTLVGIGFSNLGGTVHWGPTALGAMPVVGKVVDREVLTKEPGGELSVKSVAMEPLEEERLPPGSIHLDLVRAPLFVESTEPLFLTYFMAPSHKFRGKLTDRMVRISTLSGDGSERVVKETVAAFVGGDNWQQTIELSPEEYRDARAVIARLLDGDQTATSATMRLAPIGYVENLGTNGNLLQVGGEILTFVLPPADPSASDQSMTAQAAKYSEVISEAPELMPGEGKNHEKVTSSTVTAAKPSPALLLLTPDLQSLRESRGIGGEGIAGTLFETVSINGNDPRLGLGTDSSPFSRRTAAEWVAAASQAAGSGEFTAAKIVVNRDFADIGLSPRQIDLFLIGMIALLKTNDDLGVSLDYSVLRRSARTRSERDLLVSCMEIAPLVKQKGPR